MGFLRLLARVVVCAWSHRPDRTERGLGDWREVSCARCRESWREARW